MYMYKKLLVLHHLILSKDYLAHFADQLLQFAEQSFLIPDQQTIRETFAISSLLILVCEDNTYNLLGQRNYFQKQSLIVFLQKYALQICSIFTGAEPYGNVISKCCVALLHGCSTVNLLRICRTPF